MKEVYTNPQSDQIMKIRPSHPLYRYKRTLWNASVAMKEECDRLWEKRVLPHIELLERILRSDPTDE